MGQFQSTSCRVRMDSDLLAIMVGDDEVTKIREKLRQGKKISEEESNQLCCKFGACVNGQYWEYAEKLISLGDPKTLYFALKFTVEYIWFLRTQEDHDALIELIEKIIANGACDFANVVLSSSFLGSCVLAFQIRRPENLFILRNFEYEVVQIAERLCKFMCKNAFQPLDGKADAKLIDEFTECIGFSSSHHPGVDNSSYVETQLQFSAFKKFLDLAGNKLTSGNRSWALQMACLGLSFYSYFFDPDCLSGIWGTTAIPNFLGVLVERGADDITKCLVQASCSKSTELVRILLKVARMNNLEFNLDMVLKCNCQHSNVEILKVLVEDGNAFNTMEHLAAAGYTGNKQVVEVFVKKGFQDIDLYAALVSSTSTSQVDVAAYLLPLISPHFLAERRLQILKNAGRLTGVYCLDGVAFLLCSDYLGDPAATYAAADKISMDDNDDEYAELRKFLKEHWSEEAFLDGIRQGEEYYMNFVRILKRGESPICLKLLPPHLRVAIAYMPLYQECVKGAGGCLVSQRLRGQLVEAVRRLGGGVLDGANQCKELLAVLEGHLPQFSHK